MTTLKKALDEFLTPYGVTEANECAFSNSWAHNPTCEDIPHIWEDPCTMHPERLSQAEFHCSKFTTLFHECHALIDSAPFYDFCKQDRIQSNIPNVLFIQNNFFIFANTR